MRMTKYVKAVLLIFAVAFSFMASAQSVRQERRLITDGNKLYLERKFKDAAAKYKEALNINGASAVAKYNLGMAEIKQVVNTKDTTERTSRLITDAVKNLSEVAQMAKEKPGLAAKANYNLGNLEFNRENYGEAIKYYKQSLRIDPKDEKAKKNLRIAQLKQQNQDKNKDNKDQNKDQQDQQNQDKDKDKDQNKDQQNQNQNQDQQDKKDQQQDKNINQQTASQILQAIDNKENQTRARVNRANKGDKSAAGGARTRRW